MTQVRIPLNATPSQVANVQLGQQNCRIAVYQKRTGLFVDLSINNVAIMSGVLARDRVFMVRGTWQGFAGDLVFIDTQGKSDPDYTGLASRFELTWIG